MPDKIIQDQVERCFQLPQLGLSRLGHDFCLLQRRIEEAAASCCGKFARWLTGRQLARVRVATNRQR